MVVSRVSGSTILGFLDGRTRRLAASSLPPAVRNASFYRVTTCVDSSVLTGWVSLQRFPGSHRCATIPLSSDEWQSSVHDPSSIFHILESSPSANPSGPTSVTRSGPQLTVDMWTCNSGLTPKKNGRGNGNSGSYSGQPSPVRR